MVPMQGKLASSQFDLWYTELFCVPELTSVFLSSCDSDVEDSLEFNQANRGSLHLLLGKRNCSHKIQGNRASSRSEGEVSWVFSSCGRNLGYILGLQRGCPFETGVCSVKSEHLSRYEGHLGKLNYPWEDNMDASVGESVGQAFLIIWHSYIGNFINIHEESGIVTF